MKRFSFLIFAGLLGCGGGGGDDSPADSVSMLALSGRISLGPVTGASVNLYLINPDGSRGRVVASVGPLATSDFSLSIVATGAPLLAVASGGTYLEESTQSSVDLNNREMLAVLRPRLGSQSFAITPLSHLAAVRALNQIASGGGNATTAIGAANRNLAKVAGLGDSADITSLVPSLPNQALSAQDTTADSSSAKVGLLLAGLSQMASGLGLSDSLILTNALAQDFGADGIFDGLNNGTVIPLGTTNLSATAWTTALASAQTAYVQSSQNGGVFTTASQTTQIATPAGQDGEMLIAADLNSSVMNLYGVDSTSGAITSSNTFSEAGTGYLGIRCQKNVNLVLAVNAINGYESFNRYTLDFNNVRLQSLAQTSVTLTSVVRMLWDLASSFTYLVDYQSASVTPFALGALPAASLTPGPMFSLTGGSGPVDAQPDATGHFLFTLAANAQEIDVLQTDFSTRSLSLVQRLTLPPGLPPLLRLRTERTGKYVYVLTDSGEDGDGNVTNATLLTYNWNGSSLSLNNTMMLDGEIGPISVTRDGNFLVMASLSQGTIESYRINPATGVLTKISAVGFDEAASGLITNLTIDNFGQTIFVVGTGSEAGFLAMLQLDPGSGQIYFVNSRATATATPSAIALCSQNF